MKNIISKFSLLFLFVFILWDTFQAFAVTTTPVKLTITYPTTDTSIWAEEWMLVNAPNWLSSKFVLKNEWWDTLCIEEKSLPVINWILTYNLWGQYGFNASWDSIGCNMDLLTQKATYKVNVYVDLNKNLSYSDSIDFISWDLTYRTNSDPDFQASYMDESMMDNSLKLINWITLWDTWSLASEYNLTTQKFTADLVTAWNKTKTFDFDKDWINEAVVKPTTWNWVIYLVNQDNWWLENAYSSANITLDDNTNIFVTYKWWNFLLYANTFWIDPNTIKTNLTWTSYSLASWVVTTSSLTVKSFKYWSYAVITIWGKDITFNYNSSSRQYEQQLSVDLWVTSWLYDSLTSSLRTWTPFATDSADYYGWIVKELTINWTTITWIDWVLYWDFNKDNKLDFIAYRKATNSDKVYFTVYLRKTDWSYKEVLKDYLWDTINIWDSIIDNSTDFSWVDIHEIIVSNWTTKDIFKINWAWSTNITWIWLSNTVTKIASFQSSFYYMLWTTNTVNLSYASIWANFRDMNNSNANDKFLLVGNYKANKDWYDYYDYSIKKYDWNQFVDLTLNWQTSWFKVTWNKIWFQKIATSSFYVFYIDQSSQYSYTKPDKTQLYYIHSNKIYPIMSDVLVNNNNTASTQDWTSNEWGSKLLINSTFWFFWVNVADITSGILWIYSGNYISSTYNAYTQHEADSRKYFATNSSNLMLSTVLVKTNLNSIFTSLLSSDWLLINLDDVFSNKTSLYNTLSWSSWGIWNPRISSWNNTFFWITNNVNLGSRYTIWNYISLSDFTTKSWLKLFYKSSTEFWVINSNISSRNIINYWTDQTKHYVNNLRTYNWIWFTLASWYLYDDTILWQTIYVDNGWIWFLSTSLIKNSDWTWWRWIPYLDSWNYWNFGINRLVWGDSLWISTIWWATGTDYGYINRTRNVSWTFFVWWNVKFWNYITQDNRGWWLSFNVDQLGNIIFTENTAVTVKTYAYQYYPLY